MRKVGGQQHSSMRKRKSKEGMRTVHKFSGQQHSDMRKRTNQEGMHIVRKAGGQQHRWHSHAQES